jgi:hypothetical protein
MLKSLSNIKYSDQREPSPDVTQMRKNASKTNPLLLNFKEYPARTTYSLSFIGHFSRLNKGFYYYSGRRYNESGVQEPEALRRKSRPRRPENSNRLISHRLT